MVAREALTLQARVRFDGGATNNKEMFINMELKIKRLTEDAILPIRAHKGDAGIDLTCTIDHFDKCYDGAIQVKFWNMFSDKIRVLK